MVVLPDADIDLSALVSETHLLGLECEPVRLLHKLQALIGSEIHKPRIEFMTHSQTNPDKVSCLHCWHESPEVQHAFRLRSDRARRTRR